MSKWRVSLGSVILCLSGTPAALAQSGPGEVGWTPDLFGYNGVGSIIEDSVVFDDGTGPALYVAGSFRHAGTTVVNHIARWDGEKWTAVSDDRFTSVDDPSAVNALAVFDDGTGPALYAGGNFNWIGDEAISHIGRWDGDSWGPVGGGVSNRVLALHVFDDGNGPALFAGGDFLAAQNIDGWILVNRVARWDGAEWSALEGESGNGITQGFFVSTIETYQDASGPALFIGGGFSKVGGIEIHGIARWDGSSWQEVGGGISPEVHDLEVADHGDGALLYAVGIFSSAGSVQASNIASWDGEAWAPLGTGLFGDGSVLLGAGEPGAQQLHVGGGFLLAGLMDTPHFATWTGTDWQAPDEAPSSRVLSLVEFDEGDELSIFVSGNFEHIGDLVATHIARLEVGEWSSVGPEKQGVVGDVNDLAVANLGDGERLYVVGRFGTIGPHLASSIAAWDGAQWSTIENELSNVGPPKFTTVLPFDDGTGPKLAVGGEFDDPDDTIRNVALFDGVSFSPLGDGLNIGVLDLAVYDDGSGRGQELYAAGRFHFSGETEIRSLARWDGSAWQPVVDEGGDSYSLVVWDDGEGPALFVSGRFRDDKGDLEDRVARWNGTEWQILGTGHFNGDVLALAVFDDGTGESLYAGGWFSQFDPTNVRRIGRWNGDTWVQVGEGFDFGCLSLFIHDDGTGGGKRLLAGGRFEQSGEQTVNHIAAWDGTSWQPLDAGLDGDVENFGVFDDGNGPALFAVGEFAGSGDFVTAGIARWGPPLDQPGMPADLTFCEITLGTTDNPLCDVANLVDDDDIDQILRSQFGFTAFERNLTEIVIEGNGADATSMASIETRDGSDTTNVVAKVKARNFTTNSIVDIAQYNVSFPNDDTSHSTPVNSADFIDANGDVEVRLRYVAPATFTPLGFTVGLDQVEVMVN